MLIEYKVKYDKDGLTITEKIEGGSSGNQPKPGAPIVAKSLAANFEESQTASAGTSTLGGGPNPSDIGGGPNPRDVGGAGAGLGSGPVTIIGPFIFLCPHHHAAKDDPEVKNGN